VADRTSSRKERFEALFAENPDPWDFETSSYEHEKRAQTIAALDGRRFGNALEIGCATGVLTKDLAKLCDWIIGIDVSDRALSNAKHRLRDVPNIELRQGEVPSDWPAGSFDLIVFSEVLYFLDEREIETVSRQANRSIMDKGVCLLVNWTGSTDLPLDGHDVVGVFTDAGSWNRLGGMEAPQFRIDKFEPR